MGVGVSEEGRVSFYDSIYVLFTKQPAQLPSTRVLKAEAFHRKRNSLESGVSSRRGICLPPPFIQLRPWIPGIVKAKKRDVYNRLSG